MWVQRVELKWSGLGSKYFTHTTILLAQSLLNNEIIFISKLAQSFQNQLCPLEVTLGACCRTASSGLVPEWVGAGGPWAFPSIPPELSSGTVSIPFTAAVKRLWGSSLVHHPEDSSPTSTEDQPSSCSWLCSMSPYGGRGIAMGMGKTRIQMFSRTRSRWTGVEGMQKGSKGTETQITVCKANGRLPGF